MIEKKYLIILFLNFIIFLYCGIHNISINIGDKIYSQVNFFLLKSVTNIQKKYTYFKIFFENIKNLNLKIEKLKNENRLLKVQLLLKKSNETVSFNYVPANVILKNFLMFERYIFIDVGENQGIFEGDGVISDNGLVGIVVKSFLDYSKVLLITDIRFSIDVSLKKSKLKGLLIGTGKDLCKIKYLPLTKKIEIGDYVITSNFSEIFPSKIPVGTVVKVEKNNLYKICFVRPFVDFEKLHKVFIVKK